VYQCVLASNIAICHHLASSSPMWHGQPAAPEPGPGPGHTAGSFPPPDPRTASPLEEGLVIDLAKGPAIIIPGPPPGPVAPLPLPPPPAVTAAAVAAS
jgi:hypothetical protein